MEPITFGTIGTSAITERFLDAVNQCEYARYVGCYSRDLERARLFGERFGAELFFDSLEEMATSPQIDAVYIASPNALHVPQALVFAKGGKHLLVEKALGSNASEVASLFEAAHAHGVVCLEAMRTLQTPGFLNIERLTGELGTLTQAAFHFGKVTSRIRRLEAGEYVSQFDPALSEGALMDMGVYTVEPAVMLFGRPKRVSASALTTHPVWETPQGCETIDLNGTVILDYGDTIVSLTYSKITDDLLSSQVCGRAGTITWADAGAPRDVLLHMWNDRPMIYGDVAGGANEMVHADVPENDMLCELELFCRAIHGDEAARARVTRMEEVSRISMDVMDEIRSQIGVRFPADLAV